MQLHLRSEQANRQINSKDVPGQIFGRIPDIRFFCRTSGLKFLAGYLAHHFCVLTMYNVYTWLYETDFVEAIGRTLQAKTRSVWFGKTIA